MNGWALGMEARSDLPGCSRQGNNGPKLACDTALDKSNLNYVIVPVASMGFASRFAYHYLHSLPSLLVRHRLSFLEFLIRCRNEQRAGVAGQALSICTPVSPNGLLPFRRPRSHKDSWPAVVNKIMGRTDTSAPASWQSYQANQGCLEYKTQQAVSAQPFTTRQML